MSIIIAVFHLQMPCLIESIIANSDLMKYWKMAPQHCLQSSLSTWNRFNGIKKN